MLTRNQPRPGWQVSAAFDLVGRADCGCEGERVQLANSGDREETTASGTVTVQALDLTFDAGNAAIKIDKILTQFLEQTEHQFLPPDGAIRGLKHYRRVRWDFVWMMRATNDRT